MDNPKASITNNSDVDIDVYDVYNPSGEDKAVLTYTFIGSVKQGETKELQTIHFASQLQAMYSGTVTAIGGKYYTQFPVAVMPIVPMGSKKKTSHTIVTSEKQAMEQAYLFQKYAVANPDSALAKSFTVALADPDQENAVNTFFAATKNFALCTMSAWTAVVTWSSQFTCAWQGTYYLYSVPDKDSKDTPALTATVVITADTDTAVLTMQGSSDPNSLAMNGTGLEEANIGQGVSVSLQPAWMNVVQTDGTDTKYLIGPGMAGTVGGVNVFGTGSKRPDPKPDSAGTAAAAAPSRWDNFFQMSFKDIFSLALGVITAYLFYKTMKGHGDTKVEKATEEAAKKPDASDQKVDEARKGAQDSYKEEVREVPKTNPKVTEALQKGASEMGDGMKKVSNQKATDVVAEQVDTQVDKLSDVLSEQPPSDKIEQTAETLSDVQTDLANGDLPSAKEKLTDVTTKIEAARTEGTWKEFEKEALEQTETNVKEAQEQSDAIDEAQKKQEAEKEKPADEQEVDTDDLAEEPREEI